MCLHRAAVRCCRRRVACAGAARRGGRGRRRRARRAARRAGRRARTRAGGWATCWIDWHCHTVRGSAPAARAAAVGGTPALTQPAAAWTLRPYTPLTADNSYILSSNVSATYVIEGYWGNLSIFTFVFFVQYYSFSPFSGYGSSPQCQFVQNYKGSYPSLTNKNNLNNICV